MASLGGLVRMMVGVLRAGETRERVRKLELQLDLLRSRVELGTDFYAQLEAARETEEYQAVFTKQNPLVTICISTYNRCELLIARSLNSVLHQTYENIEVVVVGDCCTDETQQRMSEVSDSRVHFVNLPERGRYPKDPVRRWQVAGSVPENHALSLARGDFITNLDDDDEYLPERIEKLVKLAQSERAELVYHPFFAERGDKWVVLGNHGFRGGQLTTSSVMYHRWFASFGSDINAHLLDEPNDWNRLRKFLYLGARIAKHPEPLLRHYVEGNQKEQSDA